MIKLSLTRSLNQILLRFNAIYEDNYFEPIINTDAGQVFPVLSTQDVKNIQTMKWGVSFKGQITGIVHEKGIVRHPVFYKAIRQNRCLIPLTSIKFGDLLVKVKNEDIFCIAGVFLSQNTPEGVEKCFAVITVPSNKDIKSYSESMPVILTRQEEDIWIKAGASLSQVTRCLKTLDSQYMNFYGIARIAVPASENTEKKVKIEKKDNNIDLPPWWQKGKIN